MLRRRPIGSYLALFSLAVVGGCGPGIRHQLATADQRHITYDDLCHLQDWFDQRAAAHAPAFRVLNETATDTARVEPDERGRMTHAALGEGTWIISGREDRLRFDRLLHDEYSRLPQLSLFGEDTQLHVHVAYWQTGSIRRIRPDVEVTLEVDGTTVELPSHPCMGEYLFGTEAYAMRRNVMSAESARSRGEIPAGYADAGTPAADASDDR